MFKSAVPMILTAAALLGGCAKEKPYEENTDKLLNKLYGSEYSKEQLNFCTVEDPCLWAPSVADTPYNVTASRPYWQGAQKLVVTQLTEDKLKVLQVEEDERFRGNINNFSPVAEFDIAHVDYTCQEDALGECSNKEIEDSEKPWEARRFARINDFSVVEKNSLPIQFDELFQAGCYTATEKRALGKDKFKVENGALNVRMKVTYEANPSCVMLREMEDLRYLNFTVDYHYSLVRLSQLADKNYQQIEYPSADESYFGFFKTVKKKKTVDNHDHYMGLKTNYMNRWSPNRKEVVYYLNADFYKPEMAGVLKSTKEAIETVNNSLKLAGAGFRIVLKDGRNKDIGDIRNSFLVLVSDPQASGVIGYGPSVVNPQTGEIVSARTVMYHGTIKKFISRTYDELFEEVMAAQDGVKNNKARDSRAADRTRSAKAEVSSSANDSSLAGARVGLPKYFVERAQDINMNEFRDLRDFWSAQTWDLVGRRSAQDLLETDKINENLKRFQRNVELLSKQNFYHDSLLNLDGEVARFIKAKKKMWDDLTEEDRAEIIDTLLPVVWKPTLVHEFGHNLGLRHNFYGNVDEENYYTKAERLALGIEREITYSSVMDYAFSNLNELPVMGKYDVAALKFAYAREVETQNGRTLKVDSTLDNLVTALNRSNENKSEGDKTQVKKFKYCSDEHVPYSSLCNRHDVGKNYTEIVSHYIDQYNKNYKRVNFRNRRYDFSGRYGDWSYAIRTLNVLAQVRVFFDRYDQKVFQGDYEETDVSEAEKKELADLKQASDLAFDHLMDILETPAYHCMEMMVRGGQIAGFGRALPFNQMAKGTQLEEYGITFDIANGCDYLSYFESQKPDPSLPPGVSKMYLSFGKYFNNSLDISIPWDQKMDNDSSQMDVRGYWFDKVVASVFLSSRSQSPTTIGAASNGSFLDYPQYKERFMKFIKGFLTNKFTKKVPVAQGGNVLGELEMTYSFDGNHMVNKSYNDLVNYVFGLGQTQTDLKSVVMNHLKKNFKIPESPTDYNIETYHDFNAARLNVKVDVSEFNYDKVVEFVDANGKVESRFGLYNYNTFGLELAAKKDALDKITGLSEDSAQTLDATVAALSQAQNEDEAMQVISSVEDQAVLDILANHGDELSDHKAGVLTYDGLASSFFALAQKGDSWL